MAKIVVKKKWFRILAPAIFNSVEVGETFLAEPETAIGRCASTSLMAITGDPQRQSTNVRLKITDVKEGVLNTKFFELMITPPALRRLVRRNKEIIDDSIVVKTSDEKIVRIKPLLVTRGKCTGGVMADLRKAGRIFVAKQVAKLTWDELVKQIMTKEFQKSIAAAVKKIYPLQLAEIRMLSLCEGEKLPKPLVVK